MNKHSIKWLFLIILIVVSSLLSIAKLAARSVKATNSAETDFVFYNPIVRKAEIYNQFGKKVRDLANFPQLDADVVSAKFFPSINKIAFVSSRTESDRLVTKLNLYDIASSQNEVLDEESPKFEENGVAFQVRISSIGLLSPDGEKLIYEVGGWEYCGDRIIDLKTKKKVTAESCNSLRFSPSGKELVSFSTPGMSSGADFSFASVSDIFSSDKEYVGSLFKQVEWNKVTGDVESLKNGQTEFFGIDKAEYIDENSLHLIQSRSGFGFNLYRFDKSAMTLDLLSETTDNNNPSGYVSDLDLINNLVTSNIDPTTGDFEIMSLSNYKIKKYNVGIKKDFDSEYLKNLYVNRDFALIEHGFYSDGYRVDQKAGMYLLNLAKNKSIKLESLGKSLLFMNKI